MCCSLQPAAEAADVSQHQLNVVDLQAVWRNSLQPWRTILLYGVRHLDPEVRLVLLAAVVDLRRWQLHWLADLFSGRY